MAKKICKSTALFDTNDSISGSWTQLPWFLVFGHVSDAQSNHRMSSLNLMHVYESPSVTQTPTHAMPGLSRPLWRQHTAVSLSWITLYWWLCFAIGWPEYKDYSHMDEIPKTRSCKWNNSHVSIELFLYAFWVIAWKKYAGLKRQNVHKF